jgi:hypothetical protein
MALQGTARSLDEWYLTINRIYLDRNFYRDRFSLFAHLVEILGGLSLLATHKQKPNVTPESYVPKALAWWMALCGKVGVRSVEQMVWAKFPSVCSYCHRRPHEHDACVERKTTSPGLDWKELTGLGERNLDRRPASLVDWQEMFAGIYPVTATEDYPATVGRFTEELGELAEALRVSPIAPGYFLSEAADVFAWLMHLQNLIHSKRHYREIDRGAALATWFESAYPDRCSDCLNPVCTCPPILPGTLGRIAHEIPKETTSFVQGGTLLTQEEAIHLFNLGARTLRMGGRELEITASLIREIYSGIADLKMLAVTNEAISRAQSIHLASAIEHVQELAAAHRVTQESMDQLARAIAQMPTDGRSAVLAFLCGLTSSVWATVLIQAVNAIGN